MDEQIDNEEQEHFIELEAYSPHDNIAAAFNALNSVEGIDDAIMSELDKRRVRQIRRWSLKIIHFSLKEIYEMIFEENNETPPED